MCLLFCSEVLAGAENDDYVADSEDEATKNFKVRVRMQNISSLGFDYT